MFELRKVEKSFPGVRALKGVDLKVAVARSSGWSARTVRASRR